MKYKIVLVAAALTIVSGLSLSAHAQPDESRTEEIQAEESQPAESKPSRFSIKDRFVKIKNKVIPWVKNAGSVTKQKVKNVVGAVKSEKPKEKKKLAKASKPKSRSDFRAVASDVSHDGSEQNPNE